MAGRSLAQRFGAVVRRLRTAAGLSQEDLADLCGIHRTYVGSIERGEKVVSIETASKLARALKIPLSDLFSQVAQHLVPPTPGPALLEGRRAVDTASSLALESREPASKRIDCRVREAPCSV